MNSNHDVVLFEIVGLMLSWPFALLVKRNFRINEQKIIHGTRWWVATTLILYLVMRLLKLSFTYPIIQLVIFECAYVAFCFQTVYAFGLPYHLRSFGRFFGGVIIIFGYLSVLAPLLGIPILVSCPDNSTRLGGRYTADLYITGHATVASTRYKWVIWSSPLPNFPIQYERACYDTVAEQSEFEPQCTYDSLKKSAVITIDSAVVATIDLK